MSTHTESSRPGVPRRAVVAAGAGAAAALPALSAMASPSTAAEVATGFAHGVASGDPRPRSVVIWTRVTPTRAAQPGSGRGPRVEVVWEVATDRRFRQVVRRGRVSTGPGRDHTVKVDVTRLQPGTAYYYRFTWAGTHSRVGRTATAPATSADPQRLRVGVVSCSNWRAGYFAAYRHLAARDDLDAVLHLGDYFYESGAADDDVRRHEPAHETVSLADYRRRHAQHKRDPDLADLHARVPFVTTWDDHEVTNDSWKDGAENHDAERGRLPAPPRPRAPGVRRVDAGAHGRQRGPGRRLPDLPSAAVGHAGGALDARPAQLPRQDGRDRGALPAAADPGRGRRPRPDDHGGAADVVAEDLPDP